MSYSKEKFVSLLEQYYGKRNEEGSSRFGGRTAADISKELGINQGHYTKLVSPNYAIYKEASYRKACQKLDLLLEKKNNQLDQIKLLNIRVSKQRRYNIILSLLSILIALTSIFIWLFSGQNDGVYSLPRGFIHQDSIPLQVAFKRIFDLEHSEVVPYRKDKSPEDFPCIKYQGQWGLDEEAKYQIPIPFENERGFHYRANTVDMFVWCGIGDKDGDSLTGLEILNNEIWYDKQARDFKTFGGDLSMYNKIDFERDTSFVRVATVYSLFKDEFDLLADSISRRSERWARYKPILMDKDSLNVSLPKHIFENVEDYIEEITETYIGNLVTTSCEQCPVPMNHPNVELNTPLTFRCEFLLPFRDKVVSVPYAKRLILKDQYDDQ